MTSLNVNKAADLIAQGDVYNLARVLFPSTDSDGGYSRVRARVGRPAHRTTSQNGFTMTSLNVNKAADLIAQGVMKDSGATVSAIAGIPSPTKGYAVSLPGYEYVVTGFHIECAAYGVASHARFYIETHRALLASDPTLYVGAWVDGDRLVFDISRVHGCLADAVHAGVAASQDAIYSFETGTELRLTYDDSDVTTAERSAVNWALKDLGVLDQEYPSSEAAAESEAALFTLSVHHLANRSRQDESGYYVTDLDGKRVSKFHGLYEEALDSLIAYATKHATHGR